MTISYNWLCDYLPEKTEPEKLSRILTSIGLEVESLVKKESIKGGLAGLVAGEVLTCEKHPDADKLSLTTVDIGTGTPLQIVCGASNVAKGQKVVVATIGTTIYPLKGEPITLKKVKIRGAESQGMICAEDEIGLGDSHEGIIVLSNGIKTGLPVSEIYKPEDDYIFEIGLTPNRIDAMCHMGTARDVCAYLSHHQKKDTHIISPFKNSFKVDQQGLPIQVTIENMGSCQRYCGVSIQDVKVGESPDWLKKKLLNIGLRPTNNIVDATNFILHETGQPLHAFDSDKISDSKIIVKTLTDGTPFLSLDEKERKLSSEDLMICDGQGNPLCMGGILGGLNSGVTSPTKNIFLESAWFNPKSIRKSSIRHGLRTDAAIRFEKGVDISNTVNVLKRAALLIKELAGGEIASEVVDVYPQPKPQTEIPLKFHYLKKLSGKNYHPDTVKDILHSLGFEFIKEGRDELWFRVPYSKPDITLPADLVEEIMRIDGLDNVDIPALITIAPSIETLSYEYQFHEKVANYLAGNGFYEIFTNSITNSIYYPEETLKLSVKMINNLSTELDIMRPSMLETGLETIGFNLNRKNLDIRFFEFGKTYSSNETGKYKEEDHLSLYMSGNIHRDNWNEKERKIDFYTLKGICERVFRLLGLYDIEFIPAPHPQLNPCVIGNTKKSQLCTIGALNNAVLETFGIKQPVFFADLIWENLLEANKNAGIAVQEIPKYPAVHRDLSMVLDRKISYLQVEKMARQAKISRLKETRLFDLFESEKLGPGKKSVAVSFTFLDEEKTLTDKEVDNMMSRIILIYEKELGAEIRK